MSCTKFILLRIYGDSMMEEAANNKEENNLKATVTRVSKFLMIF